MDLLEKIEKQLMRMSEREKDLWILTRVKLLSESEREGILLSLSGEKNVIDMPTYDEIDKFCERVEKGEIYFEYETHYYEFDSEGRYVDDWEVWYNDVFAVIPFLNRIFAGCHDLLRIEEYRDVVKILNRVCELEFQIKTAEASEDEAEQETFSLCEADEEGMLSGKLRAVGEDWIRAVAQLTREYDPKERMRKLLNMFENPVCKKVKPRILLSEGISREMFIDMTEILEREIADLEVVKEKLIRNNADYRELYKTKYQINRKTELRLDICVKCLKILSDDSEKKPADLAVCWRQIQEGIKWLSYEHIDNQPEIDEIRNLCETLIGSGQLEQENWEVRKAVLTDIIQNRYYDHYNCGDVMQELAEKLCMNREEYLIYADIMDASVIYKEKAAYLYYKHGKDDKYISYLEESLGRRSKEYSALIAYYQEHERTKDACRIAKLGLEQCKEDLTDCFICLMSEAQRNDDQEQFKKLYASAKRRKHVDTVKIKRILEKYTLEYYAENADVFFESTVSVDFQDVQKRFMKKLPAGACILDFGCGSGRDTKVFLEKGYLTDAVDGSGELCEKASRFTGINVKQMLFQELSEVEKYDGIWACSSILHLPKPELRLVLEKMVLALKTNGVIYTSFKHSLFEGIRNGRYFTDFTYPSFCKFLHGMNGVSIEEYWISIDARPDRGEEKWLNLILRKN